MSLNYVHLNRFPIPAHQLLRPWWSTAHTTFILCFSSNWILLIVFWKTAYCPLSPVSCSLSCYIHVLYDLYSYPPMSSENLSRHWCRIWALVKKGYYTSCKGTHGVEVQSGRNQNRMWLELIPPHQIDNIFWQSRANRQILCWVSSVIQQKTYFPYTAVLWHLDTDLIDIPLRPCLPPPLLLVITGSNLFPSLTHLPLQLHPNVPPHPLTSSGSNLIPSLNLLHRLKLQLKQRSKIFHLTGLCLLPIFR